MAYYHKKTPKSDTIAIPVHELAMVAVFCLWNVIFFVWVMPGDGMFFLQQDGDAMDEYPHKINSLVLSILWGMWIVPCLPIAKFIIHGIVIVASHMTGIFYMLIIIEDQTRSQAACLWPPCGL